MAHLAIFSLAPHATTAEGEALIARTMAAAGDTVTTILCNGVLPRCGFDMILGSTFHRLAQCANCLGNAREVHRETGAGASRFVMLDELTDDLELASLYRTIDRLSNADLLTYTADGLPVGSWLSHSLRCEYKGDRWERLPDWPERARGWLKSTVALIEATEQFILRYKPDVALVINGLPACEQALIAVARRRGVRALTYEGGQVPKSVTVSASEPACFYRFSDAWADWRDVPLTEAEAAHVETLLHFRGSGASWQDYVFSPTRSGDARSLRERLRLDPDRSLLAAFTNQAGDTATFAANVAFPSHRDWLAACVQYAQGHPEVDLVIRVHPVEAMRYFGRDGTIIEGRDPAAETLAETWPQLPDNVRLVDAGDSLSSYDLLAIADVALVYVSTIALEAAAIGLPVVSAGHSHYADTGITHHVDQAAAFAPTLDTVLATPQPSPIARELAWRYLYFWLVRAPFPMLGLFAEPPTDPRQAWRRRWLQARLVGYFHGDAPFIAPPAAWRRRDQAGPATVSPESLTLVGQVDWERPEAFCDRFIPILLAHRSPIRLKLPTGSLDLATAARRLAAALHRHAPPAQWPDIDLLPGDEATVREWLCLSHAWLVDELQADDSVWLLAEQTGLPLLPNAAALSEWLSPLTPTTAGRA